MIIKSLSRKFGILALASALTAFSATASASTFKIPEADIALNLMELQSEGGIIQAHTRDRHDNWRRGWWERNDRSRKHRYRHRHHRSNTGTPSTPVSNPGTTPTPAPATPGTGSNCYFTIDGDRICPQQGGNTPPAPAPTAPIIPNPQPTPSPVTPTPTPAPPVVAQPPSYEWPPGFEDTPTGGSALASLTEPSAPPLVCSAGATPAMANATFSPTTEDFMNPERGFYMHIAAPNNLTPGNISNAVSKGHSVVLAAVDLGNFRNGPLSQAFLTSLDQSFGNMRNGGVKGIVRFAYEYCACPDAPINTVLQHIEQLKPILQKNADVIAYVQAGFIGMWGEWHSSSNGLDSDANKVRVRDALMAAVPNDIMIQFRYPPDWPKWYGAIPLGADQAFTGTKQARTAFHNDCYMANNTDLGTFPKGLTDPLKDYAHKMTEFTPFGGETCGTNEGSSQLRQSCSDILKEGPYFHQTYLNLYYDPAFPARWKAEGCFPEVSRMQGYRFQLDKATHPTCVPHNSAFTVEIDFRNVGWSRIFTPRHLTVTLRNKATGALITGTGVADMRAMPPQSTASESVHVTLKIPADAAAGQYDVLIGMPDAFPQTTGKDKRYNVRFANASSGNQGWDAATGLFKTGTTVDLNDNCQCKATPGATGGSTTPAPAPTPAPVPAPVPAPAPAPAPAPSVTGSCSQGITTPAGIPAKQVNLADFGGRPGASSAAIINAFNQAFAALKASGGGTLTIAPGTYSLGSHSTTVISVRDLKNTFISGCGAQLTMTTVIQDTPTLLMFFDPNNVTVAGLSFYDFGTNLNVNWKGAVAINVMTTKPSQGFRTVDITADNVVTMFRASGDNYMGTNFDINGTVKNAYYGVSSSRNGRNSKTNITAINVRRAFIAYGGQDWNVNINATANGTALGSNAFISITADGSNPAKNINVNLTASGSLKAYGGLVTFYQQASPGTPQHIRNVKAYVTLNNVTAPASAVFLFPSEPPGTGAFQPTTTSTWEQIELRGKVNGSYSGAIIKNPSISSGSTNSINVDDYWQAYQNMNALPAYFRVVP